MPSIDKTSAVPYYQQLYAQIVRGIEGGLYSAGHKLPSIRRCAHDLGVSNTTVELAYQNLVEKGYVQAKRGSGYVVCRVESSIERAFDGFPAEYRAGLQELIQSESSQSGPMQGAGPECVFDFTYDSADDALFPFSVWARASRDVFFEQAASDACLRGDCQGLRALREQISRYLGSERGLICAPEQILVMPTERDLALEIVSLLDTEKVAAALWRPGYEEVLDRLDSRNLRVQVFSALPDLAWRDMQGFAEGEGTVLMAPFSQLPADSASSLEERAELLRWVDENGAYLIDDECGWELDPSAMRKPPLSLSDTRGRVISLGTFSSVFTPSLCLSYAVLPPRLMLEWKARHSGTCPSVPWQTQAAMASFMSDGRWRVHVRKMKAAAERKRQALADALACYFDDAIRVVEIPRSSLMLVQVADGRGERELVEAAMRGGVRVHPASQWWRGCQLADWRYVALGYSGMSLEDIEPAMRALADAWGVTRGNAPCSRPGLSKE